MFVAGGVMEATKNFNDLTDPEKKELEKALRNRAEKSGRGLLQDVRCVYSENNEE